MITWQILCVLGIAFIILEIFTPSMFFLNFSLAAFITALSSLVIDKAFILVIVFFAFSFLSFIFLRPIIINKSKKVEKTGIEGKYIGQYAKVIEDIDSSKGVITLYDERWNAKTEDGSVILAGEEVKIIKNIGLIMIVERLSK